MPYDGFLTKADGKGKWWEVYDPQDPYVQRFLPYDTGLDVIHHLVFTQAAGWEVKDRDGKVPGEIELDPDAHDRLVKR